MHVRWLEGPRRLPLLFSAVTFIPALALGWLTFQLVDRDRTSEAQNRAEQAADRIVAASHQRLSELETELNRLVAAPNGQPPEHTILVSAAGDAVVAVPTGGLAYLPTLPASELPPGVFEEGERLEHQQGNLQRAIEVFQALARSGNVAIRGGALLRMARNQAKARQIDAALETYDQLAELGAAPVQGYPAALLALAGRCSLLEKAGRRTELSSAAAALRSGLASGTWPLLHDAYDFYRAEAERWSGQHDEPETDRQARAYASAFESTYHKWVNGGTTPQRQWLVSEGRPVLVTSIATDSRLITLLAGIEYLRQSWDAVSGSQVLLSDGEGRPVAGAPLDAALPQAVRATDATQLPWTLRVARAPSADDARSRRTALLAGLAMVLLLFGVSTYFTLRGVTRELAVARLQSDFVSAVSHEFRTPLASIRHLSDMLAKGRVTEPDQQQCYDFLSRESERLEGLVEELLDFGRIEGGAYRYRFESIDIGELLRQLVATFQDKVAAKGYRVELSASPPMAPVSADREALSRAIWNLFDNAVKYSPDSRTIWVSLVLEGDAAVISVRDRGLGIPSSEQKEIFGKFVRGSNARAQQIKGTGIGLAMVRHIVEAHRGEIRVDSEPNQGSTFSVMLPMARPV